MNTKPSRSSYNLTGIICPKCNQMQAGSDECINCGVIFKKYKKPPDNFESVYRVKRSFLLFWNALMMGGFLLGVIFFITRDYWPGGIEISYTVSVLSITWGIVFLHVSFSDKKFVIRLTDKGLKIGEQPFIRWENIYRAKWHNKTGYYYEIPIKTKWIDLFYYDAKERQACKVVITHKIENIRNLYDEIERRMHESDEHVYVRILNKREYVEFGIWLITLLSGFLYLTLVTASEEFESALISSFVSNCPTHAILVGILFLGIGALLALRWRE